MCRHLKEMCIYIYMHVIFKYQWLSCSEMGSTFEYCQALSCQSDDVAYPSLTYSWWYVADCCFSGRNSAPTGKYFYRWIRSIHPIESQKTIIQKYRDSKPLHLTKCPASMYFTPFLISGNKKIFKKCSNLKERSQSNKKNRGVVQSPKKSEQSLQDVS